MPKTTHYLGQWKIGVTSIYLETDGDWTFPTEYAFVE